MDKNIKILGGFDTVVLTEKIYGETHFKIKNNDWFDYKYVRYRPRCKFYHIYGHKEKYIASKNLKKQLKAAEKIFNAELKNALKEKDGYCLIDYGIGRFLAFKHLESDRYHFFVLKKLDGKLIRIESNFMTAADFIYGFSFSRWGFVGGLEDKFCDLDNFPLYLAAKKTGDKFLEYEIKYMADIATQDELDYLNEHDSFISPARIYLKKDIYDVEDVEILTAKTEYRSWFRKIYECDIIIDGLKRSTRFSNTTPPKLHVHSLHKITECRITERLADKIIEALGLNPK